jgi:hypothetical protein
MLDEERRNQYIEENELIAEQGTERDRVLMAAHFMNLALETDWTPGDDALTKEDVSNLSDQLLTTAISRLSPRSFEETIAQVAASSERDAALRIAR